MEADYKMIRASQELTLNTPEKGKAQASTHKFNFEKILHNSSQDDVFQAASPDIYLPGKPLLLLLSETERLQETGVDAIQSVLAGYNATILCYGQTGAGKTYTMSGARNTFQNRGLIPRIIQQLYSDIRAFTSKDVKIRVQYVEVYNELIYDLLEPTTEPSSISVLEEGSKVVVHNAKFAEADSESAALQLFFEGEMSRITGEHALNKDSSRSHAICNITVDTKNDPSDPQVVSASLCLVDLAGSERVQKTKSTGMVLREAGHINKSLSLLEQVVIAIANGHDHIPFRSSKLTHVLKHSLGGNSKTILIANVWADEGQVDESLSTCRFAQRMAQVESDVSVNVVQDNGAKLQSYAQEVRALRQELALVQQGSGGIGTDIGNYAAYTADQQAHLMDQLKEFFAKPEQDRDHSPLDLSSLRQIRELFFAARRMYQAVQRTSKPAAPQQSHEPARDSTEEVRSAPAAEVGDVEGASASFGVAPESASPSKIPAGLEQAAEEAAAAAAAAIPRDPVEALEVFKKGKGVTKVAGLERLKAAEVTSKREVKEVAIQINAVKRSIDNLGREYDELTALEDNDGAEVKSEQIKLHKQQYRDLYRQLQDSKRKLAEETAQTERVKEQLIEEFSQWHKQVHGCEATSSPDDSLAGSPPDSPTGKESPVPGRLQPTAPKRLRPRMKHAAPLPKPTDYNDETKLYYDAQKLLNGAHDTRAKIQPKQVGMGTGPKDASYLRHLLAT